MTAFVSTAFSGRTPRRSVQAQGLSAQGSSAQASARLRITRRGKAVIAVLVATPLIVIAALFGPGALGAAAGTQGSHVRFDHVTVAAGQSLWQIAETVAPGDDPRDVVSAIADLNGLTSSVVVPGERLAIPQQYTAGH
jgi:LysM domain.